MANYNNMIKWIAALESGEYKQGRGSLISQNESGELCYCCLGVAAKIAGFVIDPSGDSAYPDTPENHKKYSTTARCNYDEIYNWLGATNTYLDVVDDNIRYSENGEKQKFSFVSLNDVHNLSFTQIADAVRNYYCNDQMKEGTENNA